MSVSHSRFFCMHSDIMLNNPIEQTVFTDLGVRAIEELVTLTQEPKIEAGKFMATKVGTRLCILLGTPVGNIVLYSDTHMNAKCNCEYNYARIGAYVPKGLTHLFESNNDISAKEFEDIVFAAENIGHRMAKRIA